MRLLPLLPLLLPLPALADDIPVSGRISAVTVYPDGARITRQIPYSIPAGDHRLILSEIPEIAEGLRAQLSGTTAVTLGPLSYRGDFLPPRSTEDSAAIAQAKAEVERLEQAVATREDEVDTIRLAATAAQARIDFLTGLGRGEGATEANLDTLRALSRMVGEEVLTAAQEAQQAQIRARTAEAAMKDLRQELADARQALAALETEDKDRDVLTAEVSAEAPSEGMLELTYTTYAAGWQPIYSFALTTGDSPALSLERAAYVRQSTGENWQDVTMTLSTSRPSDQTEPGVLGPERVWAADPAEAPMPAPRASGGFMKLQEDAMAAPVAMAEVNAGARYDGLTMQYDYPRPVSVATGADNLRLSLDTKTLTPQIFASAVPRIDQNAYLVARVTNDTGEILAPTDAAEFYVDGAFVGRRWMDLVANGDEMELGFGPIQGLRLERVVKNRSEGGRGFVSRANARDETATITLRNLTPRAWQVELTDRVPYAEQDDVSVEWTATPAADRQDIDDQRGLLGWDLTLEAGAETQVTIDQKITWPTGKVLR